MSRIALGSTDGASAGCASCNFSTFTGVFSVTIAAVGILSTLCSTSAGVSEAATDDVFDVLALPESLSS